MTLGGILIALGTAGIVVLAFACISWRVHLEMVREHTKRYGWGSYKKFRDEFECRPWTDEGWANSFFDGRTDSELHASIVKFDGKGMLLPFVDWMRVQLHLRGIRKRRQLGRKETVIW